MIDNELKLTCNTTYAKGLKENLATAMFGSGSFWLDLLLFKFFSGLFGHIGIMACQKDKVNFEIHNVTT